MWQRWRGFALLDQHVRKVTLPGVPQDREEYRERLLPAGLQVDEQLPGLLSAAAGALQRRKTPDDECSL